MGGLFNVDWGELTGLSIHGLGYGVTAAEDLCASLLYLPVRRSMLGESELIDGTLLYYAGPFAVPTGRPQSGLLGAPSAGGSLSY